MILTEDRTFTLLEANVIPQGVMETLTYTHNLGMQPVMNEKTGYTRNRMTSEKRELYQIQPTTMQDGTPGHALSTLPGFGNRIRAAVIKAGGKIDQHTTAKDDDLSFNVDKASATLRGYQVPAATELGRAAGGVLQCPTGWGKCMSLGSKVVMYDGTLRAVECIEVGEQVMGMDSTPRTVNGTKRGFGKMYRITQNRGLPLEVADDHILTLVATDTGKVVDIMLSKYLTKSTTFRHRHKLFKVAVEFDSRPLRVDPYFMGLWLGDGNTGKPAVSTEDPEIVEYLQEYASTCGLTLTKYGNAQRTSCNTYMLSGSGRKAESLLGYMRSYGLCDGSRKTVHPDFMINDREARLALLAGLLDSDGHLNAGTVFDFININEDIANAVAFVAGSLGLGVTRTRKLCRGFGVERLAYRIRISGDTHLVPTKLPRKRASRRKQIKNPLRTGFTVTALPDGEYAGISLDGDRRYLTEDFTVTHNSYLMSSMIKGYNTLELQKRNTPLILVIAPSIDLCLQNWEDLTRLLPHREVGIECSGKKVASEDIIVVTPGSLHNIDCDRVGVLFYDEVHTTTYEIASKVLRCTRAIKFGFSATPEGRGDGGDIIVEGVFGPIVYRRTFQEAVNDGAILPIIICWVPAPKPSVWKKYAQPMTSQRHGLWRNKGLNQIVAGLLHAMPPKWQSLVLVDKLEHMDHVMDAMTQPQRDAMAHTHGKASGEMPFHIEPRPKKKRKEVFDGMKSGAIRKCIANGIYRTGIDFPDLCLLIKADGGGSSIITEQVPGRTSRLGAEQGGKTCGVVVEFWPGWDQHVNGKTLELEDGTLLRAAKKRQKVYTKLGFTVLNAENPEVIFQALRGEHTPEKTNNGA